MVGVDSEFESPERAALRPLTGHIFHLATFTEGFFGDAGAHCRACWKVISPAAERDGYVTVLNVQYTGLPILMQYAWVCKDCFARYRDQHGWRVSPEEVRKIPAEVTEQFDAAYRRYPSKKAWDSTEGREK